VDPVADKEATQWDELSAANQDGVWNNLRDDQRALAVEYAFHLFHGPDTPQRRELLEFVHGNANISEYAFLLLRAPKTTEQLKLMMFVYENFIGNEGSFDDLQYISLLLLGPDTSQRVQLLCCIYCIYRNAHILQYPLLLLQGPDTPQRIQMLEFVYKHAVRHETIAAENASAAAAATNDEPGNQIDGFSNVEEEPEIENRNAHKAENGAINQQPIEDLVENLFHAAAAPAVPGNGNNGVVNAEAQSGQPNIVDLLASDSEDDAKPQASINQNEAKVTRGNKRSREEDLDSEDNLDSEEKESVPKENVNSDSDSDWEPQAWQPRPIVRKNQSNASSTTRQPERKRTRVRKLSSKHPAIDDRMPSGNRPSTESSKQDPPGESPIPRHAPTPLGVNAQTVQRESVPSRPTAVQRRWNSECMIDGCKSRQRNKDGFCRKHMPDSEKERCAFEGCTNFSHAGGFCLKHSYTKPSKPACMVDGCKTRRRRNGFCQKHMPDSKKKRCAFEGCTNILRRNGFCQKHMPDSKKKRCAFEGCTNILRSRGFCKKHSSTKPSKPRPGYK
jgi:hypothetical protein